MRKPRLPSTEPPVILVADADSGSARLVAECLSNRGFRAFHTSCGEEAFNVALARRLALAIIDVVLADMSGHTLASRLKELDPDVQILMTTGDYRPELEIRARQIGILYYAHKPADYRLIETIVAKAIKGSRAGKRSSVQARGGDLQGQRIRTVTLGHGTVER